MTDLPQGWAETSVGEISEDISYGFTAKASSSPIGPRLLRITDIQDGVVRWDSVPYCEILKSKAANYRLRSGDIVFARTGATTGKSFLIDTCPEAVFASYLIRVRSCADVLPELLAYFFQSNSYWTQVSDNISGSAQPSCNATKLASLALPLPPLAEQQRIVAKLEVLLGKVDACRKRLEKIPVILKRFRQSVLAAACSGRLTADWREESDLTGEWPTALLKDVADLRLGKMLDDAKNVGDPTRYLRNVNVRWFSFDLSDLAVMRTTENDKEKLDVRDDDLFVCEGGEPGRCAVWSSGPTDLIFQKAIHRVRPVAPVSSRWLALNLRNDANSDRLEEYFTGTTIKHLTGRSLAEYEFPLPSLPEQHEIVRRVEALFTLADQIGTRYAKAKTHVDRLTQSILAKAFRGDLVPQDPNDEPASVLLEQIRAQRISKMPQKHETNRRQS